MTGSAWSRPAASKRIAVLLSSSSAHPASPDIQSRASIPAVFSRPVRPGKSVGVAGGGVDEIVPQPAGQHGHHQAQRERSASPSGAGGCHRREASTGPLRPPPDRQERLRRFASRRRARVSSDGSAVAGGATGAGSRRCRRPGSADGSGPASATPSGDVPGVDAATVGGSYPHRSPRPGPRPRAGSRSARRRSPRGRGPRACSRTSACAPRPPAADPVRGPSAGRRRAPGGPARRAAARCRAATASSASTSSHGHRSV